MTFVVTEDCINCKYTDCVVVCPVDCFHEGKNTIVIDTTRCIDCGLCEPECPIEAILPDSYPEAKKWLEMNLKYSKVWPVISKKKAAFPGADVFKAEKGKFARYFSESDGAG